MLYKPNYCSKCGDKIERSEWNLATSRRFCDLCATEHPLLEWTPKILVIFCGIVAVMGFKAFILPAQQVFNRAETIVSEPRKLSGANPPKAEQPVSKNKGADPVETSAPDEQASDSFTAPERNTSASKAKSYLCGAPTKKGTPCTRRVKTKEYCWQHRPAAE